VCSNIENYQRTEHRRRAVSRARAGLLAFDSVAGETKNERGDDDAAPVDTSHARTTSGTGLVVGRYISQVRNDRPP
jgi:hypothetical protein